MKQMIVLRPKPVPKTEILETPAAQQKLAFDIITGQNDLPNETDYVKAKELNNLLTDHDPPKEHTTHIEMLLQLNPKQLFASMLNDGGEHCLE